MFSEYARNAVRMSALMQAPVIYVYTHDSIGLGEDGPTHQPVEQLATLRMIPGMEVWRPCDAVESAVAWKHAIERKKPGQDRQPQSLTKCPERLWPTDPRIAWWFRRLGGV